MIALRIRLKKKHAWLARATALAAAYAAWVAAFRLLILTLVTYYLTSSATGSPPRFEEISETLTTNEVSLYGIGSLLFILLIRALNPITTTTAPEVFTPQRLEKNFIPGFLHGAVLASGVILAFLLSGHYRFLGVFIQFEEAPLAAVSVLLRVATLAAFAYCEEFVFRHKIMRHLQSEEKLLGPDLTAAAITGLFYCLVKAMQFDLGLMQLITLFLLSLALSVRTLGDGDFGRGAGFWAAILIVFQPLLSLPILGNEFSGVMLVKHQVPPSALDESFSMTRFLTGGAGGPLSSFAFQLLLIFDILKGIVRLRGRFKPNGLNPGTTARNP